jgi:hypothetical protein
VVGENKLPAGVFERPARVVVLKDTVPVGTRVIVQKSVWDFWQNQHGISACYFYHIQVPGSALEGWMEQDDLAKTPDTFVPYEYRCAQGGGPTPTPSVSPLTGAAYINVSETVGVPGLPDLTYPNIDPEETPYIFTRGVKVWITDVHWMHYPPNQEFPSGIACYIYQVRGVEQWGFPWLPEDVLSPDLGKAPRSTCFKRQIPSWFVDLRYPVPKSYEVITP